MQDRARTCIEAVLYAVLVFVGTAVLGFVILPFLAIASGLFVIDTEARSFFSLLTLKGVPYLAVFGLASGALYVRFRPESLGRRLALLAANILVAWLVAATIALAILG